ncbi:hypothetical protein LBW46_24140 [Ralstonia solanacearum]|uniref:hypothetical protein n=1 Tax=Ralstonia solanacearum TaxID=305 RepID=UPI0023067B2E|nr:hypothetical protein [Ralstonia solanacearum]MDB0554116.1 hypothetical protein [Ralstonia solanacearum]
MLHLTRAFEEEFRVGQKPVDADTVGDILARDPDRLEARLTRNGYNAKVLSAPSPWRCAPFLAGICPQTDTGAA